MTASVSDKLALRTNWLELIIHLLCGVLTCFNFSSWYFVTYKIINSFERILCYNDIILQLIII